MKRSEPTPERKFDRFRSDVQKSRFRSDQSQAPKPALAKRDSPVAERVARNEPKFEKPKSLERVFSKPKQRTTDQLVRKKPPVLKLPTISKFQVTEKNQEPTPAAIESLKRLSGKNRIVLGWQDLARDLLNRVGKPADDETVAKLAHQLGPYFDQPFEDQEAAVQEDPEYAETLLDQARQEFSALDAEEIADHLEMIA